MKFIYLFIFLTACSVNVYAVPDTVKIPVSRQYFHDKINTEQKLCDKSDGKWDYQLRIGNNEEVNLKLTDVLFRKVDELQDWVEINSSIGTNNDKIRFLSYIENTLRAFRTGWKKKELNPAEFPLLLENTEKIMKALANGESMVPFISGMPYIIAKINTDVFYDSPDHREAQNKVYIKYCDQHPDEILKTIRPYVNEPFADSLVALACIRNPAQLYTYAQSPNSPEGKLIHRSSSSMVMAVAKLSQTPNALFYFPFLDDILSGKNSQDSIKKLVGNGENQFDSVGYFKLLVKTEIEYFRRMSSPAKDTPIAMFGANGLHDVLKDRAVRHFITPINTLHDVSNLSLRMRAIDPLTPEELYYMMVMGENDIYTSSYKHSFNRMLQRLGNKPRGDSLLLRVNFDYFKKFIKMAANYNKLDTFLKSMPHESSESLMKAFVANLDKANNLEDATDVADSYSSINNKQLQKTILENVMQVEEQSIADHNEKATVIYSLLKNIFLSADSANKVDLTEIAGIPSIYEINKRELQDDTGRVVQQVFFYGDEDGRAFFPPFLRSFSPKEWKITAKKEWVEIKSLKGQVWIYANKPLDYNQNLDDSAQVHLNKFLSDNDIYPSIVVHRGHSYWLPGTINRMPDGAKIVVLGSCGGYKNLNKILELSPDAHIISTKEIGAGDINKPILNYLNQAMLSGRKIVWKEMWRSLTALFSKDPSKNVRESWDNYIPPYRNLGAIFIKAYHKRMESM
jgi:hypothetical protein